MLSLTYSAIINFSTEDKISLRMTDKCSFNNPSGFSPVKGLTPEISAVFMVGKIPLSILIKPNICLEFDKSETTSSHIFDN